MFSKILLNKENLLYNCRYLKEKSGGNLCVMVKANAYGHGAKEVVKVLEDEIDYFGVSNQFEALELRPITKSHIIVFGACEDYRKCIEENISFIILSLEHLKEIIELSHELSIMPRMHLCINTGMNRYGVKDKHEYEKIIKLLVKNDMYLEGIYTHLSSITTDKEYTERQLKIFNEFLSLLPEEWNTIKHIGGGGTIFLGEKVDMYRVGLKVYGYGHDILKPVLSIESQIVDIQKVKKGEHVGYLCCFTASKNMTVATIPLGYGDGFPRKLSGNISVEINGKNAKSVGNICMDAFMVDVSEIRCKKGDKVKVFNDASVFAPLVGTTEYEILTNFSKFRGKRIVN